MGIARALWKNASYLLLDEPTASLDAANRALVMKLLRKAAENGACVIVATHDEQLIQSCDFNFDVEQHNLDRQRNDMEQYLNRIRENVAP